MTIAARLCFTLLLVTAPLVSLAADDARIPPGVGITEVTISNGDITLSGVLAKPLIGRPLACVLLLQGSDQHERLTTFAGMLAREGIATLTYDKRGRGQSTGTYVGPEVGSPIDRFPAYLKQMASDARAAFDFLSKEPSLDQVPCGLLGISQAGWLIPFVAAERPAAKFMVLWSGPVATLHEQLRFVEVTGGNATFWQKHSRPEARKLFDAAPGKFAFDDVDPRPALARLTIPELWLYGGRDVLVPADLSVERLAERVAKGNRNIDYRVFAGAPHNLPYMDAQAVTVAWIKSKVFFSK